MLHLKTRTQLTVIEALTFIIASDHPGTHLGPLLCHHVPLLVNKLLPYDHLLPKVDKLLKLFLSLLLFNTSLPWN